VNDSTEQGTDSLDTHFTYDDSTTGNVFNDGGRLLFMFYPSGWYVYPLPDVQAIVTGRGRSNC